MCDMGVIAHGTGYITMGAAKKSLPSGHLYDLEIDCGLEVLGSISDGRVVCRWVPDNNLGFLQTMCDMGVVAHGPGYITMGAAKKSQPSGHLNDLVSERRT